MALRETEFIQRRGGFGPCRIGAVRDERRFLPVTLAIILGDPFGIAALGRRDEDRQIAAFADRLQDGLAAEIIYASVGMGICMHRDAEYKDACMKAYNRWLQSMCSEAPNRIFGLAQTAVLSVDSAIEDFRRAKEMGMVGMMMPGRPIHEDYDHRDYDALWECATDLGLPICFHILTSRDGSINMPHRGHAMNNFLGIIRAVQDVVGLLVLGGVFERHPKLKLVCAEGDAGWMPHYMYRMDHAFEKFSAMEKNPLPIVLEVLPKDALVDKEALTKLFESFKKSTEVDFAQMDMAWVERLQSIVSTARLGAILLAIVLGLAVFFIAGNTIRLEIHNRRQEIIIAKLVGATNGFIQRPFLYTGFWIGFLSGVFGWFIVTFFMLILRQSVENLSGLYNGAFHLMFFSYAETFLLLAISTTLAVVGSWIVLHIQIRQLQPE